MTLAQVINAIDGYNDRERDRAKVAQMLQWESTRWQTFVLWNLHADKKHKIDDVRKLMVFDWEDKPEPPTAEEWEKINSKHPDKPRNGSR